MIQNNISGMNEMKKSVSGTGLVNTLAPQGNHLRNALGSYITWGPSLGKAYSFCYQRTTRCQNIIIVKQKLPLNQRLLSSFHLLLSF